MIYRKHCQIEHPGEKDLKPTLNINSCPEDPFFLKGKLKGI